MIYLYDKTEGDRITAVLIFIRDEMIYDIRNYAYVEGSVLPKEVDPHNKELIQDIAEKGNVDIISRVLELTIAECREMLYPYTKRAIFNSELDDKLREPGRYYIKLSLPADFSQTTLEYLEQLIHNYIVYRALAEWMSITKPEKAEYWMMKAQNAESEILTNMNTRLAKVRRKLHPFN